MFNWLDLNLIENKMYEEKINWKLCKFLQSFKELNTKQKQKWMDVIMNKAIMAMEANKG